MNKSKNTTSQDVRASVASIYSELLAKRRQEKEEKEEKKRKEEELREAEKEQKNTNEDGTKLSKKERRQAEFDNWKEVIIGLTGDDLEYSDSKKSKKKKYSKWIDDDNESSILTPKPKKVKKKNYSKEFAPELQMLKTIVADQNRFTADLQKRFNTLAGPATKDGLPPNKTMVELASVINAGRSNSLGVLREIGNLKKVVAELYIKQRKEDAAAGGIMSGPTDLALMGSSVASSLFADEPMGAIRAISQPIVSSPSYDNTTMQTPIYAEARPYSSENQNITSSQTPSQPVQEFDPSSWNGPDNISITPYVKYETIPHNIVVELNNSTGDMRFKAVSVETGDELPGCPVPTYDTKKLNINQKDMIAKGQFDETYKLEII